MMKGPPKFLECLKGWYEPWKMWLILAVSFTILTITVSAGAWDAVDRSITSSLSGALNAELLTFFVLITTLGDIYVLLPGTVLVAFLFWKRGQKDLSALFLVMMVGVVLLYKGFKFLIGRSRPTAPLIPITGYSYPSGHAISAVTFYIGAAVLFQLLPGEEKDAKRLIFASAVAGLVALSRLFLRVHYPSDVLGGVILGGLWITTIVVVYKREMWKAVLREHGT